MSTITINPRRARQAVLGAALLALGATPALAQDGGAYVGLFVGHADGRVRDDNGNGTFAKGKGVSLGGRLGYALPAGPVRVGAEIDGSYTDIDDRYDAGTIVDGGRVLSRFRGSLRARVGVPFAGVEVFGTGGLAVSKLQDRLLTLRDDRWLTGWIAGGGIEARIMPRVSLIAEYLHANYGSRRFFQSFPVQEGLRSNELRAGINLSF